MKIGDYVVFKSDLHFESVLCVKGYSAEYYVLFGAGWQLLNISNNIPYTGVKEENVEVISAPPYPPGLAAHTVDGQEIMPTEFKYHKPTGHHVCYGITSDGTFALMREGEYITTCSKRSGT